MTIGDEAAYLRSTVPYNLLPVTCKGYVSGGSDAVWIGPDVLALHYIGSNRHLSRQVPLRAFQQATTR